MNTTNTFTHMAKKVNHRANKTTYMRMGFLYGGSEAFVVSLFI
jgi:hypothetical protein